MSLIHSLSPLLFTTVNVQFIVLPAVYELALHWNVDPVRFLMVRFGILQVRFSEPVFVMVICRDTLFPFTTVSVMELGFIEIIGCDCVEAKYLSLRLGRFVVAVKELG